MSTRKARESFESLKQYLCTYSLQPVLTDKLLNDLKRYHDHLYALLCWQAQFREDLAQTEATAWFNESVSDFLQCLLLLPQGFYKVCKMSHRSAIENFIRFMLVRGSRVCPDSAWKLFDLALDANTDNAELRSRIELLRQIYRDLSNYVHSTGSPYWTLTEGLREFPAFDEGEVTKTVGDLVRTVDLINGCLVVSEREVFRRMSSEKRDAVLDCLTASEKRALT